MTRCRHLVAAALAASLAAGCAGPPSDSAALRATPGVEALLARYDAGEVFARYFDVYIRAGGEALDAVVLDLRDHPPAFRPPAGWMAAGNTQARNIFGAARTADLRLEEITFRRRGGAPFLAGYVLKRDTAPPFPAASQAFTFDPAAGTFTAVGYERSRFRLTEIFSDYRVVAKRLAERYTLDGTGLDDEWEKEGFAILQAHEGQIRSALVGVMDGAAYYELMHALYRDQDFDRAGRILHRFLEANPEVRERLRHIDAEAGGAYLSLLATLAILGGAGAAVAVLL